MPHVSEQHAQHDPLLVVSLAAGDLTGADRDHAASLIDSCAECATLHDDLLAIARATAAVPPATRSRDFRLTPEQAARLRPAGWRRFVAAFASPQLAMTRQLGVGLTTLGLAGLLVSALPSVPLGMGGSAAGASAAPAQEFVTQSESDNSVAAPAAGASAAPAAAPSAAAASGLPVYTADRPSASTDTALTPVASTPTRTSSGGGAGVAGNQSVATPEAVKSAPGGPDYAAERDALPFDEGPGTSPILAVSLILLGAGIALLLARRIARRMTGS